MVAGNFIADFQRSKVELKTMADSSSSSSSAEQQHATGVTSGGDVLGTPLQIFLMQISCIMALSQILGLILRRLHQPQVIAEVIAGICLGPSLLGSIPSFHEALFPEDSLESLRLTSELGLVLFLFVVGLEINPALLKANLARSACLSLSGQAFTWLLSLGAAYAMYTGVDGIDSSFGTFYLFIGTAMGVTAMVVLSRILAEERLMDTKVGVAVIGAAAFDDMAAWTLLVLTISIIGATSGENSTGELSFASAFYVFLLAVVYATFMMTFGAGMLLWAIEKMDPLCLSGSPPSQGVVVLTLLITVVSAWVTECIGVSSIFGAFLAGIIVPRSNGYCLSSMLAEKVEDVVAAVLLPLYFAVSGLKTDFQKLDSARIWGYTILVIICACTGKICGAGLAAYSQGMGWRGSVACGFLMNTRGLVELIILNAGLNAGIINETVFTIMVLMAVVTTCMATPAVRYIYPPEIRDKVVPVGDDAVAGLALQRHSLMQGIARVEASAEEVRKSVRVLACLPDMGSFGLTGMVKLARLLVPPGSSSMHAARLLQLGGRFSSDMRVAASETTLLRDDTMACLRREMGATTPIQAHMVLTGRGEDDVIAAAQDLLRIALAQSSSVIMMPLVRVGKTDPHSMCEQSSEMALRDLELSRRGSDLARQLLKAPKRRAVVTMLVQSPSNLHHASARVGPSPIIVPYFGGADSKNALTLALIMSLNSGPVSGTGLFIYALSPSSPSGSLTGIPSAFSLLDAPSSTSKRVQHPSVVGGTSLMARFERPSVASRLDEELKEMGVEDVDEVDLEVGGEELEVEVEEDPPVDTRRRPTFSDAGDEDLIRAAERLGATVVRVPLGPHSPEDMIRAKNEFFTMVVQACTAMETADVICGRGNTLAPGGDIVGEVGLRILEAVPSCNIMIVAAPPPPPLPARRGTPGSPADLRPTTSMTV